MKMPKLRRRKGMSQLIVFALAIIITIVTAQVGSVILKETNDSMAETNANVSTATTKGQTAIGTISTWVKIIALVGCAGLALRSLMSGFNISKGSL